MSNYVIYCLCIYASREFAYASDKCDVACDCTGNRLVCTSLNWRIAWHKPALLVQSTRVTNSRSPLSAKVVTKLSCRAQIGLAPYDWTTCVAVVLTRPTMCKHLRWELFSSAMCVCLHECGRCRQVVAVLGMCMTCASVFVLVCLC